MVGIIISFTQYPTCSILSSSQQHASHISYYLCLSCIYIYGVPGNCTTYWTNSNGNGSLSLLNMKFSLDGWAFYLSFTFSWKNMDFF